MSSQPVVEHPEQCAAHQILCHAVAHCVADDFTIPQILNASQVEPSLASRDIGDIGHPYLVRT